MVDLSIVIVNFNTKKFLLDCLGSIENEGSSIKKEIIIVDNGSTDGSVDALRNMRTSKLRIGLISNKHNLGFAKANNQGIRRARGKHIFLLNSDTGLKKNALSKLLKFGEETTDAGIVGPRLLNPDGSVQASVFHFPTAQRALREFWLGERHAFSKYTPDSAEAVEVDAIVGAAMLISQETISKIGLLDEKYFMYYEDLDYCRSAKRAGLKVYYLPGAEVVHYHGTSGYNLADDKNQWHRLIPSSKLYHGVVRYFIINSIIWSGQKIRAFFRD